MKRAGECETHSCASDATVRVYWPGQTRDMCAPCGVRATNIATAMGFTLSVVPIRVHQQPCTDPDCCPKVPA